MSSLASQAGRVLSDHEIKAEARLQKMLATVQRTKADEALAARIRAQQADVRDQVDVVTSGFGTPPVLFSHKSLTCTDACISTLGKTPEGGNIECGNISIVAGQSDLGEQNSPATGAQALDDLVITVTTPRHWKNTLPSVAGFYSRSQDEKHEVVATITGQDWSPYPWRKVMEKLGDHLLRMDKTRYLPLTHWVQSILLYEHACQGARQAKTSSGKYYYKTCGTRGCPQCSPGLADELAETNSQRFQRFDKQVYLLVVTGKREARNMMIRIRKAGEAALPVPGPDGQTFLFTTLCVEGQSIPVDMADLEDQLREVLILVPAGRAVKPNEALFHASSQITEEVEETYLGTSDEYEREPIQFVPRWEHDYVLSSAERWIEEVSLDHHGFPIWQINSPDDLQVELEAMIDAQRNAPYRLARCV